MGRNEGHGKAMMMNPMNAGKAPDDGRDIGRKAGQSDRPATTEPEERTERQTFDDGRTAERRERQKPENTEPDRNGD